MGYEAWSCRRFELLMQLAYSLAVNLREGARDLGTLGGCWDPGILGSVLGTLGGDAGILGNLGMVLGTIGMVLGTREGDRDLGTVVRCSGLGMDL